MKFGRWILILVDCNGGLSRWTVVVWYLVSEMLRNRIRWVDCDGIVSGG